MRLSSCQGLLVYDEAGRKLGHVFDFRCRGAPVNRRVRDDADVTTLVYGTVGLLERLGLREARNCEAQWQDVVAIRDGRIVVRAQGGRQRRG
jgi:hypothetical protein